MFPSGELARETKQAMDRAMKKVMRSEHSRRAFLQRAGILTKSGKLAKPYKDLDAALARTRGTANGNGH